MATHVLCAASGLSLWICSAPLSETDKVQMCAAATCQKTPAGNLMLPKKNLSCCSEAAAQLCLPEPGMEVAMFARRTDRQGAIAGQWKGPIVVEESDDKVF